MFRIRKEFTFSASHQLDGLPVDHPCSRLHGHNYVVALELRGHDLDAVGMLLDYRALHPFRQEVDNLDHQHLNAVWPEQNPTAENLAWILWARAGAVLPQLQQRGIGWAVGVSETPKTWAWFE